MRERNIESHFDDFLRVQYSCNHTTTRPAAFSSYGCHGQHPGVRLFDSLLNTIAGVLGLRCVTLTETRPRIVLRSKFEQRTSCVWLTRFFGEANQGKIQYRSCSQRERRGAADPRRFCAPLLLFRACAFFAATSSAMALFFATSVPFCRVDDRMLLACKH